MHHRWTNLDFSVYARLVHWPVLSRILRAVGLISDERAERLATLDASIICWDVRRGLPFPDETFDVVYHSHVLEHFPRAAAPSFLAECRRVLKTGGVMRVVVPDLRLWAAQYSASAERLVRSGSAAASDEHEQVIARLFDQFTRTESSGTSKQKAWVRRLERLLRGGPDKLGELHRWMYDDFTLSRLLSMSGFHDVRVETAARSRVTGWAEFFLDNNPGGTAYKPESVYVEALR